MRFFRIVFLLVTSLLWLCIEQDHQIAHAQDEPIIPIPGGCIRPTPNELPTETLCCISGFVYMNGEIVEGAEVKLESTQGHVTLLTHPHQSSTDKRPYYKFSLTGPPLNVRVGDTITLTARYSGYEHAITYRVQSGGQQVDIVIPPPVQQNYVFAEQIWNWNQINQPNQFLSLASIDTDSAGNVYVIDEHNPYVQVFSPDGTFLRAWLTTSLGNLPGQLGQPTDLVIDKHDYVYIADRGNHRIHKFSNDGEWITSWGEPGTGPGQLWHPYGIAVDNNGNVFVTEFYNHRVQKFAPQTNGSYIHVAQFGQFGDGPGQLSNPYSVAVNSLGQVFVTDTSTRIQKFVAQGDSYIIDNPSWGNTVDDFSIGLLIGISLDNDDNVYITDWGHRVLKFDRDGNLLEYWGKADKTPGQNLGELNEPSDAVVDHNNNLYIADAGNRRIQKKDGNGNWYTWGEVLPVEKRLISPSDAAYDSNGNLYIVDDYTHRVYKLAPNGDVSSWGGRGKDNGQFSEPSGVAVDTQDDGSTLIYVVDTINHRIQRCTPDGNCIVRWGKPDATIGSNDGEFYIPTDLAIDSQHNIYVSDWLNDRIQKCSEISNCVTLQLSNGITLNNPLGIVIDQHNNLYVADNNNNRVLQISPTGNASVWLQVTKPQTLSMDRSENLYVVAELEESYSFKKFDRTGQLQYTWGIPGSGKGQFLFPKKVIEDPTGKLYVLERHRISVFDPATYNFPVPTINYLSQQHGTLFAQGQGQTSTPTGSITEHLWQLSNLSTTVTITTPTVAISTTLLSPGSYTLTYQVRNEQGNWSKPVSTCCIAGQSEPVYEIYVPPATQRAWTMLLYLVGDFQDGGTLINSYERTLNQLKRSFSNTNVCIAVQVDAPAHGDTRQLLFLPGVAHQDRLLESEQAMDAPETLAKFLRWGQTACPAQHYYLAVADHGQAIQGIGWDMNSVAAENYLTIADLVTALNATNVAPIDVLHLDGCSMNLIEVAYELRSSAAYLISSQYLGWSYFAYDKYQTFVTPAITPEGLAQQIVTQYADLARADKLPFTLTALNLTQVERVVQQVDALSVLLKAWVALNPHDFARRQTVLNTIRSQSQLFNSNHDLINTAEDAYVDLLDWATTLRDYSAEPFNQAIRNAADTLISEIQASGVISPLIVANQTASNLMRPEFLRSETRAQYPNGAPIDLDHASGVSIYYPLFSISSSTSTRSADVGAPPPDKIFYDYINESTEYTSFVLDFTQVSRWNEFLKAAIGAPAADQLVDPPGPLPVLDSSRQLYLPIVYR